MGVLELLIAILLLLWLFGYFGRGRWYGGRSSGPVLTAPALAGGSWVHIVLVIVVILVILKLID